MNEDATNEQLRTALFTFLSKPRPDDLVMIYLAGDGSPDPNDSRNLYFLTYDTDVDNMGGTAFPLFLLQDVYERVIKARRVITFVDFCHSFGVSGETDLGGARNNLINQYIRKFASNGQRAVLTASNTSELSYENVKLGGGHGVFTYFLLHGLNYAADANHDGTVTLAELSAYLRDRVSGATGGRQNPQAIIGGVGNIALSTVVIQGGAADTGDSEPVMIPRPLADQFLSSSTSHTHKIYQLSKPQIQIFHDNSSQFRARASALKELANMAAGKASPLLEESVKDILRKSLETLNKTEKSVRGDGTTMTSAGDSSASERIARVFFDDLRMNYLALLNQTAYSQKSSRSEFYVKASTVRLALSSHPDTIDSKEEVLITKGLYAIEESELAFSVVAESESLTFDLKVYSIPAGATIKYKRRGDRDFQSNQEGTNTVISSLPLARWIVHIHMDGYKDQEVEHDPFRISEHRIDAALLQVPNK